MPKEIWFNLPTKDIKKSKAFYHEIGFNFHPRQFEGDEMFGLVIGDNKTLVFLVREDLFKTFINGNISDTNIGSEFLISIDAESKEEVDALAEKVIKAGGTIFSAPQEFQGWMYGFGFTDLDGHKWNSVFMDSKKR